MSDENLNLTGNMSPAEIAQHLKDIYPEFDDFDVEEVLLMQESAYLHIQSQKRNMDDVTRESKLAIDEAIARALELDDDFDHLQIHDDHGTSNDDSEVTEASIRGESRNFTLDDIDPDEMSYEELRSLGESVGSESRGLSADHISRLPTCKYKCGFFSKKWKNEKEECVICYSEYKNGAKLTTLPCVHQYHSKCINHWLRLNKNCPVCQREVKVV